jgi:CheY-like chemotaxis protein
MLRVLIIEDNQERIECFRAWKPADMHFVFATNAGSALGIIRRDRGLVFASVMLDHDLVEQSICASDLELSGTEVSKAIIENFSYETPILIHSMNDTKASAMARRLLSADLSVMRMPMAVLTEQRLHEWLDEVRENWRFLNDL